MRRRFRPRPPIRSGAHRVSGFSLLELLVVVTIMSLLVTVVPPLVSSAVPGVELGKTARELVTALMTARSRAMTRNRSVVLELDLENRSYRISEGIADGVPDGTSDGVPDGISAGVRDGISGAGVSENGVLDSGTRKSGVSASGDGATLPDDVAVTLYGADTEIPSEVLGGIRFFPDGSSSGGRITLERGGRVYRIEVDWLLGNVTVSD